MRLALLCLGAFLITAATFNESDIDYTKRKSELVEQSIVPAIHDRYFELVNSPASTNAISFKKGLIYMADGNLIWELPSSETVTLAKSSDLEEGFGISEFVVSPNGERVAYATTYHGQDLKFWKVTTISMEPSELLETPIENRMAGFSWAKNSDGLYYSFWNDKEAVKRGEKPIIEQRFRSLLTGEDTVVFDHGLAENFIISDVDGGNTLIAYRFLSDAVGIKTTFSMYKGLRDPDGAYRWGRIYPRNQFVAEFLGTENGKVYLQTGEAGDTYGIVAVDIDSGERTVIVPAVENAVLHIAHMHEGNLVLQYHTIPEQNVSVRIVKLSSGTSRTFTMEEMGFTPFGNLGNFKFATGGHIARAVYTDVMTGNHTVEMNLQDMSLVKLANKTELNFDASNVQQELFEFTTEDGTSITGRVYTRSDMPAEFVFMRYYGWISIKNSPEPREVQMALELGGAYMTLDMPGGGERGQDWFIRGSRYRNQMIGYIDEASTYAQQRFGFGPEKVVAMGRSWGGLTSLVLASQYGDNFGMINPVVPVFNLIDDFLTAWFGRIAHSDLAPHIDENGDYILDEDFYDYVRSISPSDQVNKIVGAAKINVFTNGLDDRIDQTLQTEVNVVRQIEQQIGAENLSYHRSVKGNHGARYYQVMMMSLIAEHYGLEYKPMRAW